MFSPSSRWVLAGALLALSGCAGEEAESGHLVGGLSTDLAVGFELRRVELRVSVDGELSVTKSLSYSSGALVVPGELSLPGFADGAEVELAVDAFHDKEASPFLTRSAATVVSSSRTVLLPVFLEEACVGVECASGETCVEGACQDPFVDPSKLAEYTPDWKLSVRDGCKTPPSDSPSLTIGKGLDAYGELAEDEVVAIEPGPQGGHHVWLAMRAKGLRQMGSVLRTNGSYPDLGSELGESTSILTLRKAGEGECEIWGIRYQVDRALPVEDVRGQALDIEISLEDPDGDKAVATKRVVIADSP
ncbi:MAG: hypothetical protein R3F14_08570 [Polyangiaceae bacterium]